MSEKKVGTVYFTMRFLSKPIYFLGLPPLYLLAVAIMSLILIVVFKYLYIPVLIGEIIVLKKLSAEQKKGNPDIITSWQLQIGGKKSYTDQTSLFKYLIK